MDKQPCECDQCGEIKPCFRSEDPFIADIYPEDENLESYWCFRCWQDRWTQIVRRRRVVMEGEMNGWRILENGEIIQPGDELDLCRDPWRDDPVWVVARPEHIGQQASDPRYPAHVIVRRRTNRAAGGE